MSNQQRIIYINGKQAVASINELIERADKLRAEIGKAEVGSAAFIKKSLELSQVSKQVDRLGESQQKLIEKYGTLIQIETRQAELQKKLTAGQFENDAELYKATKEVGELAQAWQKLNNIQNGSPATEVTKQISGVRTQANQLSTSFSQVATYAGLAFSIDSVVRFGTEVLKVASDFEQTAIAYEVMLGSKEKADKLQAELIDLAAKTPFELPQVQQATKSLLAFGFSAEEVIPNLTNLGNIAAGVGQDKLPQLILAFGQVRAATRLTGNELRQFTEAGVPLMDELAKQLKKPVAEIKKMVEEGEIGFPLVQKALTSLTTEGGRFANLMQRQSQTLGGVWSTFKDTFTQGVMLPVGNFLSKGLKPLLLGFGELIGTLSKAETRMDAVQKSTNNEQIALFSLINRITDHNTTAKIRSGLMTELQSKYPDFLGKLNAETVSNEQLRDRLKEVNQQYIAKAIAISAAREVEVAVEKQRKKADQLGEVENQYLNAISKTQIYLKETSASYDVLRKKLSEKFQAEPLFGGRRNEIKGYIQELEKYAYLSQNLGEQTNVLGQKANEARDNEIKKLDILKQKYPELSKILEKYKKTAEGNTEENKSGGSTGVEGLSDKQKAALEKAKDHQEKELERIREMFQKHASDLLEQQMRDDERDIERIKEKYRKDLLELEKLEKDSDKKVRTEAHTTRLQLIDQQEQEITAKKKENAEKTIQELNQISEKFGVELNDGLISDLDRKIQDIKNKYADEFAKISKAEKSNDPSVQEAAKNARLAATKAQNAEIEKETDRHYQELYAKEDKFWQDKQLSTASAEEREKLEITFHYQNILDKEKTTYEERIALAEEMARRLGAVTAKYRKEREKDAAEESKKLIKFKEEQYEAEKRLEIAKLSAAQQGAAILRDFIGKNTALGKALFAFEKGLAIAQVVKNLAIETSSLRAAAALQMISAALIPGGPAAVQVALAAKIASARINAGISIASIGAQAIGELVVPQKYDGRYTTVTGERDGKQYTPQYIGAPATGMLPNTPVLFQSAIGQPILASEKGREYLVNNESLKIPEVDWHVRAIDNIVKYGKTRQFFTGGDTSTATQKPVYQTADGSGVTPPLGAGGLDMGQLLAVLEKLDDKLDKGIEAYFTYGTARDLKNAIERITKIEGK